MFVHGVTLLSGGSGGLITNPVTPPSSPRHPISRIARPHTSWGVIRDIPVSTEWRMISSDTGTFFDTYQTTGDAVQSYSIRDCTTSLAFSNNTTSTVSLFSVDPVSLKESGEGSVAPGIWMTIRRAMFGNTEWRIKDAQTGVLISTYRTTVADYQYVPINPPAVVITRGETISGPLPANPTVKPTPIPNAPVVASAKDSIFNSRSFNVDVANLDFSIRYRARGIG